MEHLHAVVVAVGHINAAVGADSDAGHLADNVVRPEGVRERAVGAEHVHADRAVRFNDSNVTVGADGDAGRSYDPVSAPKREHECAVGIEHLHTPLGGVGHINAAVGADGYIIRAHYIVLSEAIRPERKRKRAIGVEHLHAGVVSVLAGICDYDAAVGADGDAGHAIYPLGIAAAGQIDRELKRTVGSEHLDVVVGVNVQFGGYINAAVGADGQIGCKNTAGIIHAYAGCKRAIGLEHMHAVASVVGNVNAAVGADGDGGREAGETFRPYGERKRAVRIEHLHAVAPMFYDNDAAVGIDGDAGWSEELSICMSSRPYGERKRAVRIEHLHAVLD